jgi:hypothetical protein
MGFIRFLLWTSMCIALGIFIGTWEIDGKSPAQHFKTIWKSAPVPEAVKKKLAAPGAVPTETHSEEDREAVNRLVAKRK